MTHNTYFNITPRNVQKFFDKHGADFGLSGNWSKGRAQDLLNVLTDHITAKGTTKLPGTYRGTIDVIHHFDPTSGLNVMLDKHDNFISGWGLSAAQILDMATNGDVS